MRLPLTILLGALIIGGVVGVVGIKMQPNYDESRLQPITVEAACDTEGNGDEEVPVFFLRLRL